MSARLIYDADLSPVLGSTFQPTGFPDLGAATFTSFSAGGPVSSLLVESRQSMANRLEATTWDAARNQPVDLLAALPWVRVVRDGGDEFLTSSRLEAHRLASAFVRDSSWQGKQMLAEIGTRLGLAKDTPLNRQAMARAVANMDPMCLLHGVFFAHKDWLGQPKFERAISGVIEAHHVERAVSGGRKADHVRLQLDKNDEASGGTSEGYGSVPFHRTEWTAKKITASFVVDTHLLRSYGLPERVSELLITLAQWEIRSLLDGDLRLRTACDLEVIGDVHTRRGDDLPKLTELTGRIEELLPQCTNVFGDGGPMTVAWSDKGKAKK